MEHFNHASLELMRINDTLPASAPRLYTLTTPASEPVAKKRPSSDTVSEDGDTFPWSLIWERQRRVRRSHVYTTPSPPAYVHNQILLIDGSWCFCLFCNRFVRQSKGLRSFRLTLVATQLYASPPHRPLRVLHIEASCGCPKLLACVELQGTARDDACSYAGPPIPTPNHFTMEVPAATMQMRAGYTYRMGWRWDCTGKT
eukprot:1160027-Pelagomonas_calceolata.AAC.9